MSATTGEPANVARLLVSCPDRHGIVAAISTYLAIILALSLVAIVRVPTHLGRASAEDVFDRQDPAVTDVRP